MPLMTVHGFLKSYCTGADLAHMAGGSFLLFITCHVNGCKNINKPLGSDRLPPLVPAATGKGMGVHKKLQRNLST